MIKQSTEITKEMVECAQLNGTLDKIYGQEVNRLIRQKYTASEEMAIYRHKLNGTGAGEFAEFNAYCENCKIQATATIESLLKT